VSLTRWKKISEETRFTNPWWKYKFDTVELPSSKRGEYHYVDTPGSVMVIPVFDDGTILLVNQYRYLNERESLEFVCGGVKEGCTHEEMAVIELREEAGLDAARLECIGEFNPFKGVTNEICKVFFATQLNSVTSSPDETEEFEIHRFSQEEVTTLITDQIIWDGMTLAAWTVFQHSALRLKKF
jgi:ADP-ribose pyrophosphatase